MMASKVTVLAYAKELGLVASREDGEYRLTFPLSAICAVWPGMSDAALLRKAEALAAFTDDGDDAIDTLGAMARVGLLK